MKTKISKRGYIVSTAMLYRAVTYFAPFAVSLPTVFIMQSAMNKGLERDK